MGPRATISQEVHDMALVRRASPLGEFVSLRQALDRLVEDSFVRPHGWAVGSVDNHARGSA
jgi:hypothetical protein